MVCAKSCLSVGSVLYLAAVGDLGILELGSRLGSIGEKGPLFERATESNCHDVGLAVNKSSLN
jgi:hypothetical protein